MPGARAPLGLDGEMENDADAADTADSGRSRSMFSCPV